MFPKLHLVILLICGGLVSPACSQMTSAERPGVVFVGSTPGDAVIKAMLGIPAATTCDFIRWNMTLAGEKGSGDFTLNITFGESQPNTLGFKGGGEKSAYEGTYAVAGNTLTLKAGVAQPATHHAFTAVSLVWLNDDLLHLLTPSGKLMPGNGGWSYTLNRKDRSNKTDPLPVSVTWPAVANDTAAQATFDGRSPCQHFAAEHQMRVSSACIKLKWRLVLNRDPVSKKPTTYTIRKVVDNAARDVSGRWTIISGTKDNANALIYQLDPGKGNESISLLAGDENVLFFLNQDFEPYVGDENFSYTLNRRM